MNRTLTQEETEELLQFCHERYVIHYHFQVEQMEHFAPPSIEERLATNPELLFNEVLHQTFSKFGITDSRKIKEYFNQQFPGFALK